MRFLVVIAIVLVVIIMSCVGLYFALRSRKPESKPIIDEETTRKMITEGFRQQLSSPIDEEMLSEMFNEDYANEVIHKGDEFII